MEFKNYLDEVIAEYFYLNEENSDEYSISEENLRRLILEIGTNQDKKWKEMLLEELKNV